MRTLFVSLFFLVFTSISSHGQNLVTNGEFENYSSLPNSSGDWAFCVGWNNVNLSASAWPYATPDYFHTSGTGGGNSPNTAFGTAAPVSGNAIIGLYSRHSSQLNSRDYMSRQMSAAMVPGTTYTVSFWITSGSGNYYYGSSCEHMGIRFSSAPFTQAQHENIGGVADVEVPGQPWLPNWTFYSFSFVAPAAYQYITIGNFESDANTAYTIHNNSANYPVGAYYFFDDVRVEAASPLPIGLIEFNAVNDGDYVKTTWSTSSETNNDFFTVERSIDLENWMALGNVQGAGTSQEENEYLLFDERPLIGQAYYRLKQTDFDGNSTYSDIRAVLRSNYQKPHIYPVPTWNSITIEADWSKIGTYDIIDQLGNSVLDQINISKGSNEFVRLVDLSALSSGIYYFKSGKDLQKIIKL